jgi:hypothetical protein
MVTVWKGHIGTQTKVRIGYLHAGQTRRYRFVVRFLTRPSARGHRTDNLYMDSRYTTDFVLKLVPRR